MWFNELLKKEKKYNKIKLEIKIILKFNNKSLLIYII